MPTSSSKPSNAVIRWPRLAFSIVIALLLWFAVKLVDNYTTEIELPIAYRNIPGKLKFKQELPTSLRVTLSGKGHELLLPSLNLLRDSVEIDLSNHIGERNITSAGLLTTIRQMLPDAVALLVVRPDTLKLDFEQKIYKTVPLVSALEVQTVSGYRLAQPVRIQPDSVILTGSAADLAAVNSWTTEQVVLKSMVKSVNQKVKVQNTPDIFPLQKEVTAEIVIKRYIEGMVQVPVKVENAPLHQQISVLPTVVKVYYSQPFDENRILLPADFEVAVDYNKLYLNSPYAAPELRRAPLNVRSVRIDPPILYYKILLP